MKLKLLIAVATSITASIAAASSSKACEEIHVLQATFDGGRHLVAVNGVPVMGGEGYMSGAIPMMPTDYVRQGQNEIVVTVKGADAKTKLELMKGCLGGFDLEGPFMQSSFTGDGVSEMSFKHADPVDAAHTRARAEGDDGLMDAVDALKAAVEAGDVGRVMELHAPMVEDAKRMGMPIDRLQGMLGYFFAEGETTLRDDLQIAEAMEGRVFIVTTKDGEPPIDVLVKEQNGSSNWRSGAIWGRVDGKWGVLNLYY